MCSGLFAIKDYRDAVNQDDFNKAVRKVAESKKLGKSSSFSNRLGTQANAKKRGETRVSKALIPLNAIEALILAMWRCWGGVVGWW